MISKQELMFRITKTLAATSLLGIFAPIAIIASASAKAPVEINEIAKTMTVMISGTSQQGSGIIIQRQGDVYTILTAAHVLKDEAYQITATNEQKYAVIPGSIRKASGGIDLALCKFRSKTSYPVAKLGNSRLLNGGTEIYVAGFPAATRTITTSVFVFRKGEVSANSNKIFESGYSLIYSNDTLPGMSGGPVLNSAGELVAIHGKGDREQSNGMLGAKTGFNLGIPISRFLEIASTLGVVIDQPVPTAPSSQPAEDLLATALAKEQKNDYRGAVVDYSRAIKLNPRYVDAYIGRGYAKYKLDERSNAIIDFSTAIQLNPQSARAYLNRGNMYLAAIDWEYAINDFTKALEINPDYVDAYISRGVARESWFNSPTSGMVDLNMAIILDPQSILAYRSRANARYNIGDYQGSIEDYNKAISLGSKEAANYFGLGIARHQLKDYRKAIADLNTAIQLDAARAQAYYERGLSKYELDDKSGAIQDLQKAQSLLTAQGKGRSSESNKVIRLLKKWGSM